MNTRTIFDFEFTNSQANKILSNDVSIKILLALSERDYCVVDVSDGDKLDGVDIMKEYSGEYWCHVCESNICVFYTIERKHNNEIL